MSSEGNFKTLRLFVEKSLAKKILLTRYLEFILISFLELKNLEIIKIRPFYKTFIIIFFRNFIQNDNLKQNLNKFLIDNPMMDKFLKENNMDYSILILDFEYEFNFCEEFLGEDNITFNSKVFLSKLNDYIEQNRQEVRHLINFRDILAEKIEYVGKCIICEKKTLYKCKKCNQSTCENHLNKGYCDNCADKILEEYDSK
ncbi:MAG: hypothetical protein JXA99_04455 [Candidatus Lokiarchaeota archaeon]|nr:hypothetical protein [Candidatus Lokiarchaeota archaeon]